MVLHVLDGALGHNEPAAHTLAPEPRLSVNEKLHVAHQAFHITSLSAQGGPP